jgi:hypothetical protein
MSEIKALYLVDADADHAANNKLNPDDCLKKHAPCMHPAWWNAYYKRLAQIEIERQECAA